MIEEKLPDPSLAILDSVNLELNGVTVLSDVSLQIESGVSVGLIGANGAGKSSIANVICGYYRPTFGHVYLDGNDLTKVGPATIARMGVRRSFQSVSYLTGLSIHELVMLGADISWPVGPLSSYFQSRRTRHEESRVQLEARNLLEKAGLAEFADRSIDNCPYGVRKFADVVRAFMTSSSRLVILDEPTSGVGESERERLLGLINDLRESRLVGSLLIVDHNVGFVRDLCKRVIVLEEGRVLADGNCDDVLTDRRVIESFVGSRTSSS